MPRSLIHRRTPSLALAVCAAIAAVAACAPAPHESPGAAPQDTAAQAVERYTSPGTAGLGLPFSDAVRVGDLLILSGQIGNRPGTFELVEGGIEAEARQALDNVGGLLQAHGLSYDDVVKCTVMLVDIAEWPAFNTVYESYFTADALPARSAFAASGLALGARIEIECWAAAA